MHKKNSEKPKVSVITVCFNLIKNGRGKTFVRALESVAEQSSSSVEVCAQLDSLKREISKILDSVLKTTSLAAETLAKVQKKDGSGIV